jgi:hypothetical protein
VTATPFLVPLQPFPQTFNIMLSGTQYTITYKWNVMNGSWVIDIGDVSNNPIVTGVPLITGADLMAQLEYLGLGGALIVQSQTDPDAIPTETDLGSTANLFYVTP